MIQNPEKGYLRDILYQPAALEATYQSLLKNFSLGDIPARLKAGDFKNIVLTGMGSSHFILYPLYYFLVKQPVPVTIIEGSELIHYAPELIKKETLIITTSQSGSSAETVKLLDMAETMGACVLGITNTATSPLAKRSEVALLTEAGVEATVSCKTYVSALVALRWLQDGLLGRDLTQAQKETAMAGRIVQAYLDHWQEYVDAFMTELNGMQNFFMTGRGPSLAAVFTGSLTVKESTLVHAEGLSCAALRHGPKEMMRQGTFVLVFAGPEKTQDLNKKLMDELNSQGAKAFWVSTHNSKGPCKLPECPEGLIPILEILPTEMFNLALAELHHHTAGVFEHACKITDKE